MTTETQKDTAKRQRTLVGKVVSNKMDKSVVVSVQTRVKHPVLGKFVNRTAKYKAHDEANQYNEGDTVEIASLEIKLGMDEIYFESGIAC